MTGFEKIGNWALHAYADGELDAAEREAVEKMLANDEEARALFEQWRRQKQEMKSAFDPVLSEPVPSSLLVSLRRRNFGTFAPLRIAAALAIFLLGGAAGWLAAFGTGAVQSPTLAAEAIAAHEVYAVDVRHPVEVGGSERGHLRNWLSKRLGTSLVIPDLSAQGYSLLGGRLLTAGNGPAALLMYEDLQKSRITIFFAANASRGETALRVEQRGKLIACYWLGGPLAFALAGEMDRARMMELARAVYDQVEG